MEIFKTAWQRGAPQQKGEHMSRIENTMQALRSRGFEPVYFATAREAADYLTAEYAGRSVAFGGSRTDRKSVV